MTVAERGHELPCDRWRWSVGSVLRVWEDEHGAGRPLQSDRSSFKGSLLKHLKFSER